MCAWLYPLNSKVTDILASPPLPSSELSSELSERLFPWLASSDWFKWNFPFICEDINFFIFIKEVSHVCTVLSCFSHVWLFAPLWTVAQQAPLSMGFSRQEYWSGLPCPPPGHPPNPGIEPRSLMSPALAGGFFTTNAIWKVPTWDRAARKVLACLFGVIKIVYSQRSHKNIFPKPCGC